MKTLRLNRVKIFLLSVIACLALAFGAIFLHTPVTSVKADVATDFSSSNYKTAGASVRIWNANGEDYKSETTDRRGIRFHVLMKKSVYETYSAQEGFATYTLILPERMLSGDLTVSTANVMKLETTEKWYEYEKDATFMESVAYVYSLPVTEHATDLVFRGVVSLDGGATIAADTEISCRSMAYVAKAARDDATIAWTGPQKTTLEYYIPKYEITYVDANDATLSTETLEYGDDFNVPNDGNLLWHETDGKIDVEKGAVLKNTAGAETTSYTLEVKTALAIDFTGILTGNTNWTAAKSGIQDPGFSGTKEFDETYITVLKNGEPYDCNRIMYHTDSQAFSFNNGGALEEPFVAGDMLTVKKGSLFYEGELFYELDNDYVFTFNGTNWTVALGDLSFSLYSGSADSLIVTPSRVNSWTGEAFYFDTSTITVLEDAEKYTCRAIRWDGNIAVFHFHAGAADSNKYPAGTLLTIKEGSQFWRDNGFYTLAEDFNAYYNGTRWVQPTDLGDINLYDFKALANYTDTNRIHLQMNSALFSSTAGNLIFEGSAVLDDGTDVKFSALCYHGDENNSLEIDLPTATIGQKMTIKAGSKLWMEQNYHTITTDFTLVYSGKGWGTEHLGDITFESVYTSGNNWIVLNPSTTYTEGPVFDKTYIEVYKNGTTAYECKQINYFTNTNTYAFYFMNTTDFASGDTFTVKAGSVFYFGSKFFTLTEDLVALYKDSSWVIPNNLGDWDFNNTYKRIGTYLEYNQIHIQNNVALFNGTAGGVKFEGTATHNGTAISGFGAMHYHPVDSETLQEINALQVNNMPTPTAGDVFTLCKDGKLWMGGNYYTLTADFSLFFDGNNWVVPNSLGEIDLNDFATVYNASLSANQIHVRMNNQLFSQTAGTVKAFGAITLDGAAVSVAMHYHAVDNNPLQMNMPTATKGQVLKIAAGTQLWQDGNYYTTSTDFTLVYSGSKGWGTEHLGDITFESVYTSGNNWIVLKPSITYTEGPVFDKTYIEVYKNGTTAYTCNQINYFTDTNTYAFHFMNTTDFASGDTLTIKAGSVFYFGTKFFVLVEDATYTFNGSSWTKA